MYTPFSRRVSQSGHWTCVLLFFIHVPSAGHTMHGGGSTVITTLRPAPPPTHHLEAAAAVAHLIGTFKSSSGGGATAYRWEPRYSEREIVHDEIHEVEQEREEEEVAAAAESSSQALVGTWSSTRAEGFDQFLERAMGVGWVKRSFAVKAAQISSQRQTIQREGDVTYLAITDPRGTMRFEVVTDGRPRPANGFLKLPVQQTAVWDGADLVIEERYAQHLGGAKHGRPCAKHERCPVVRTRRSVDAASGDLVIELERALEESGETVRMRTYYRRDA